MICWLGAVEACVKKASWNWLSTCGSRRPAPASSSPGGSPTSTCASSWSGRRGAAPCADRGAGASPAAPCRDGRLAQRLLLRLVGVDGAGLRIALLERRGRAHRRARPQERRPAREAEPGLVPQEDQVRLDREAFLHHPARVVHVAVERAVGQVEHPHAVEPALRPAGRAAPVLIVAQRHRAVHRIAASAGRPRRRAAGRRPAPCRSGATCGSCGRR